jgi:hypothetical protein
MVILAVDSTARPFECDIGEKPTILAGYRDFDPCAACAAAAKAARGDCGTTMMADRSVSESRIAAGR